MPFSLRRSIAARMHVALTVQGLQSVAAITSVAQRWLSLPLPKRQRGRGSLSSPRAGHAHTIPAPSVLHRASKSGTGPSEWQFTLKKGDNTRNIVFADLAAALRLYVNTCAL